MAFGKQISTWFEGAWHGADVPILSAADHGTWLGTLVFDGARTFDGVSPDLDLHCQRIVKSAEAMGMTAPVSAQEIEDLVRERLPAYDTGTALYIRPMMWSKDGAPGMIAPDPDTTGFAICLEDLPMPDPDVYRLGVSTFRRPRQDTAVTEAKAACLYPNNARILTQARQAGFDNALSLDVDGHVAETASSNVFLVRGSEISTPAPNGTFLAGITRRRIMDLLSADGVAVREASLTLEDFEAADEIVLTGNAAKVTSVTHYKDRALNSGAMAKRMRDLYWDYAKSGR